MAEARRYPSGTTQQGLRALFVALLALLLAACNRSQPVHTLSGPTMGTTWTVKLVAPASGVNLPALQNDLQAILESLNRQMSTYRSDSEISRFNVAPADTWHVLAPDFFEVLSQAVLLADATGGAYDPTVGPLVNLWGFGPDASPEAVPGASEIDAVRQRVGWSRIRLNSERRAALQPGELYLDLSSVAKGYAVDKLGEYLSARGIEDWLVEVGGELRASGRKPDGSAWQIAVERPVIGVREAALVLPLKNKAIATSGDYRNFLELDGRRFSHIIDPRTGQPVPHRLASVTVLADTCAQADALATALTVLGPEEGMRFADARQLAVLFIVREDKSFQELSSPAFSEWMAQQEIQP